MTRSGFLVADARIDRAVDEIGDDVDSDHHQLDSEGLIRVYPQRGIQIIEADPKPVNDAHDYRLLLERAAIVDFAKRAPDATVKRLRAETEKLVEALAKKPGDRRTFEAAVEAAWNFHEEIVDFQGNAIVSHHYRQNSARIRLFRSAAYRHTISEQIAPALGQHLRVLDACARRDTEEAARLIA